MKELLTYDEETMFDLSIKVYGTVEGAILLMKDNALGVNDIPGSGKTLQYRENIVFNPFKEVSSSNGKSTSFYYVTANQDQNVWDLAVQEYGAIDQVFNLIKDNPIISGVNTMPISGDKLSIRVDPVLSDYKSMDYFRGKIKVSTGGSEEIPEPSGIGYMRIGGNFIVS